MNGNNWSLVQLWNESFEAMPRRKTEPRDYLYASELLGSPIDIYMKMAGIEPTNPPNDRSLRKFEVGNLIEWCVKLVLIRGGVLKAQQVKVDQEMPGLLSVHGRLDFIAGGKIDYERAMFDINHLDLPDFWDYSARIILEYFKKTFGDKDLAEYVFEVKSSSAFMFQYIQRLNAPQPHHNAQNFHYVRGLGRQEGRVTYVSKDDALMAEFSVFNNEENFKIYRDFIEMMTGYWNARERPEPQPEILWDPVSCKFSKNFKVEYSNYLSMLYGYQTPEDYRNRWAKLITQFNRTMKRCINGDKMTPLNKETIAEAKQTFGNWDELVYDAQVKGVLEEAVEEND